MSRSLFSIHSTSFFKGAAVFLAVGLSVGACSSDTQQAQTPNGSETSVSKNSMAQDDPSPQPVDRSDSGAFSQALGALSEKFDSYDYGEVRDDGTKVVYFGGDVPADAAQVAKDAGESDEILFMGNTGVTQKSAEAAQIAVMDAAKMVWPTGVSGTNAEKGDRLITLEIDKSAKPNKEHGTATAFLAAEKKPQLLTTVLADTGIDLTQPVDISMYSVAVEYVDGSGNGDATSS